MWIPQTFSFGYHELENLLVQGRNVTFMVKRTKGTGCAVPQIYLGFPGATKPTNVLRYFEKVCEDSAAVVCAISDGDVSNWDTGKNTRGDEGYLLVLSLRGGLCIG